MIACLISIDAELIDELRFPLQGNILVLPRKADMKINLVSIRVGILAGLSL